MQQYNNERSSRVKDLADLVVSMCTERVDADVLMKKLNRESALRGINAIEHFEVPDEWIDSYGSIYEKEINSCIASNIPKDIEEAAQAVADWLDPIIDGTAKGMTWLPEAQRWQ